MAEDPGFLRPASETLKLAASRAVPKGMRWPFSRRRKDRRPHRKKAGRDRARQKSAGEKKLFLDGEDAARPVDLQRAIESDPESSELTAEVEELIQRLEARVTHDAECALLVELQRGLRTKGLHLPPVPQVILRVQQLINSGSFNLSDLAREIELDPALVTKVVGIANSPFYAGMGTSESVQDAIVRIGVVETRNILMAIMMRSRVLRVQGLEDLTQELWQHALAASVTCRSVGAQLGIEPDRAFMAGLIHDVGRVVILSAAGEVQRRSRGRLRPDPLALDRVMQELHPILGAIVAHSWHLSSDLEQAVRHHHDPASAPEAARIFAQVLGTGDELARDLLSTSPSQNAEAPAAARLAPLGLSAEVAETVFEEAREAFEELAKIL